MTSPFPRIAQTVRYVPSIVVKSAPVTMLVTVYVDLRAEAANLWFRTGASRFRREVELRSVFKSYLSNREHQVGVGQEVAECDPWVVTSTNSVGRGPPRPPRPGRHDSASGPTRSIILPPLPRAASAFIDYKWKLSDDQFRRTFPVGPIGI